MNLTEDQIERYSRHIILTEVGGKGQQKLLNSRILVIGAGGLGSPAAVYLAAAGVGTIGIVDGDEVDLSNLQRQILHTTKDVGVAKVESAKETLSAMNPDVTIETYNYRIDSGNIRSLINEYDFILDGTDNFPTKFLINDACVFENKPLSHCGILRFDGQLMTIIPNETACYRCVFLEPPPPGVVPTCSQAGGLGVMAGVMGTLQATEALKYIVGIGELYSNRLYTYNALSGKVRIVNLKKNNE
ncbi:MAG: HesA/MoeB/ThiF family protein, partial [bacterium]|nr:HesA/MoeB/ThiF family protein [bacterium]